MDDRLFISDSNNFRIQIRKPIRNRKMQVTKRENEEETLQRSEIQTKQTNNSGCLLQ